MTVNAEGDFSRVREQVRSKGEGKVLVIDNRASMHAAMLGDRLAAAAIENGWQGAQPASSRIPLLLNMEFSSSRLSDVIS